VVVISRGKLRAYLAAVRATEQRLQLGQNRLSRGRTPLEAEATETAANWLLSTLSSPLAMIVLDVQTASTNYSTSSVPSRRLPRLC
jgi:hypothetical protein